MTIARKVLVLCSIYINNNDFNKRHYTLLEPQGQFDYKNVEYFPTELPPKDMLQKLNKVTN